MKLIVITSSKSIPDEPKLLTEMFEAGLPCLHMRKPRLSTKEMQALIEAIPAVFHNRIMLHSHHELALKYKLRGIHLSRVHLSKRLRYWWIRFRLKMHFGHIAKSRSYSRLQQVYQHEDRIYDYYFLRTIFDTMTGKLYGGYFEEGLRSANEKSNKMLVARGGTRLNSIAYAHALGFKGIAYHSFIWKSEAPVQQVITLLNAFREQSLVIE